MGNFDALKEMMDAFDNAKQGLAIWDENDNMVSFNKLYEAMWKKIFLHIKPKVGINFKKLWKKQMPESSKKANLKKLDLRSKQRKKKLP